MMTAEHRRPLAAFVVVLVAACLILVNGLKIPVVDVLVGGRAPEVARAPDLVLGQSLLGVPPQPEPQAVSVPVGSSGVPRPAARPVSRRPEPRPVRTRVEPPEDRPAVPPVVPGNPPSPRPSPPPPPPPPPDGDGPVPIPDEIVLPLPVPLPEPLRRVLPAKARHLVSTVTRERPRQNAREQVRDRTRGVVHEPREELRDEVRERFGPLRSRDG